MPSSDQIVVAGNGKVYVAPTTTTAPTDATSALTSPWVDLGYVSEEGITATFGRETETVAAWQSLYPVRRITTAASAMVKFNLRQWNADTVPFALGGGTVVEGAPGEYEFTPADPATIDERSLVVEWQDGTRNYRLYFPKGMVVDAVETTITRSSAADLPISFEATPASGDDAYTLYTDDAAFE